MMTDYFHSVVLEHEKCIGCTYCLKICPTEAIRLKNGKASIIGERCIDCGECIRVCPNHAKSSITNQIDLTSKFKYSIALTLPIIYSQFNRCYSPQKILSALKSLGFNQAADASMGFEIAGRVCANITERSDVKPLISSSCPAILRLIQIRFPELLDNVLDMETPVEIAARLIKQRIMSEVGISRDDIGVILITPCTARVTSIRSPLGTDLSYIDGAISLKDVYGPMLKALTSTDALSESNFQPTKNGVIQCSTSGQAFLLQSSDTLSVYGIHDAISVLEEIEMGRLSGISFVELMSCPGGCLGGPLTPENRYIAQINNKCAARSVEKFIPSQSDIQKYMDMYDSGLIRFNRKIKPKSVIKLDPDIEKSIKKMNDMHNIINNLPGIDCGICGSPTCRSFAEDIVTGTRDKTRCPIAKIASKSKWERSDKL